MKNFKVGYEPPAVPVGMKLIGAGVVLSCLALCALFSWGIYLNIHKTPAESSAIASSAKDNRVEDGLLVRESSPAFRLKLPALMEPRPLQGSQIYSGSSESEPFSLRISVDDPGRIGFDDWVKGASVRWVQALKLLGGSEASLVHLKPTDLYDRFAGVKVRELIIEWTWQDGTTRLTNVNHFILKEGKIITLAGTVLDDTDVLLELYEAIDLAR